MSRESAPENQPPLDPTLAGLLRHAPAAAQGGDGEDVWFEVLSAVDRTYADLVDYQERLERQNHELEDMRSFLGSVLASVSDALIVVSRAGEVQETSASVGDLTGRAPGAWQGRALADLFTPDSRERLDRALAEAANARAPVTIEAALAAPQGPAPVELSISPRLDERQRVMGYVLTGRPLGELRQAYSDLARSHEALIAAQAQLVRNEKLASLGRLLAGVAHELNNPISFVYANAHALGRYTTKFETYFDQVARGASREELIALRETLKLDREVRNLRAAVEGARDGAERVRDIVEDLRRLSAEGSGERVIFDLAETARVAADWIRRGTKSEVEITFAGTAALLVTGRPGHIQQVIMNLIQNAIDALESRAQGVVAPGSAAPGEGMTGGPDAAPNAAPGGGRILITARTEEGRGLLKVADDGPGVPEDLAQAVFDPFFTTKPVGKGTGLGLSISHKIVEEHGGRLKLCPHGGPLGGACFSFDLPLAGAAGADDAAEGRA
ncbi:MAG: PAS domain-containing protein [Sphingomonadales bacterium]|nr:PAS domain-containing protein [Sphingomonadales bacterium]